MSYCQDIFLKTGSFWMDCGHPNPRINIPWSFHVRLSYRTHVPKGSRNIKRNEYWNVPLVSPQWKFLCISLKAQSRGLMHVFRILRDIFQCVFMTSLWKLEASGEMSLRASSWSSTAPQRTLYMTLKITYHYSSAPNLHDMVNSFWKSKCKSKTVYTKKC